MATGYRLWWRTTCGGETFYADVDSPEAAVTLAFTLATYDKFLISQGHEFGYSGGGGLEVCEDGNWSEWEDAEGNDVLTLAAARLKSVIAP
jgi:hypothetical protein